MNKEMIILPHFCSRDKAIYREEVAQLRLLISNGQSVFFFLKTTNTRHFTACCYDKVLKQSDFIALPVIYLSEQQII